MQTIDPPAPPKDLSKMPQKQQAQETFIMYTNVLDVVGKCLKTRQGLIDWINQQ